MQKWAVEEGLSGEALGRRSVDFQEQVEHEEVNQDGSW